MQHPGVAGMHLVRHLLAADFWLEMQEAADKQKAAESAKEGKAAPPGPTEEARCNPLGIVYGSAFITCWKNSHFLPRCAGSGCAGGARVPAFRKGFSRADQQ